METLERSRKIRRESVAQVAVIRCGAGRGLAAVRLVDETGTAAEHFVPFAVHELPSQQGRDYIYAGLVAALERLRSLDVRRVLIQTDDPMLVDELERKADPHRELTLPYIILGCKLNEFSAAKIVAVPAARLAPLRARAAALASTVYRSVA
ncbi:MAG TPA: hypothetical protein VEJ20_01670 [Candidatus Eremiobacteraceae bacterium]|nr:hypothetical protein [Candidatus Eremiobacteraceae bacterium]